MKKYSLKNMLKIITMSDKKNKVIINYLPPTYNPATMKTYPHLGDCISTPSL